MVCRSTTATVLKRSGASTEPSMQTDDIDSDIPTAYMIRLPKEIMEILSHNALKPGFMEKARALQKYTKGVVKRASFSQDMEKKQVKCGESLSRYYAGWQLPPRKREWPYKVQRLLSIIFNLYLTQCMPIDNIFPKLFFWGNGKVEFPDRVNCFSRFHKQHKKITTNFISFTNAYHDLNSNGALILLRRLFFRCLTTY